MPHLFIAVTAHGYGHLAQVAPVAHELMARLPGLRITLQGTVDARYAEARMPPGCRTVAEPADVALPMDGPLRVRWAEGLERFIAFDKAYDQHLRRQIALFEQDPPDLVLADIPWLPLDAARRLGLTAIGLCSLNWHDILLEGPIADQVPGSLVERLHDAYAGADLFLRPVPTMPMAWLPNGRTIGPLATRRGRDPSALRAQLGIADDRPLVLLQFGGAGRLPLGASDTAQVCFLTPDPEAAAGRDDAIVIGTPNGPDVLDVLAACDAILTKPGYGTFAEAACNGIPVGYVPRADWPEERYLVDWLRRQVPVRAIPAEDLAAGRIREPLEALLRAGIATPVEPTGTAEAAALIEGLLAG